MSRVLLATCARLPHGDEDAELLGSALESSGIRPEWVVWDDRAVDRDADLVVLRSTWDYAARRSEFLAWTATVPLLANPANVVAWSSDKRYLADLSAAGLPVVPTTAPATGTAAVFPSTADVVVKPSVGAGSKGAGRFRTDDAGLAAARAHVDALTAAGYTALVQPYLTDVDTRGETALVYIDGVFTHAVRKGPMLPPGTAHGLTDPALFVAEAIVAREPDDAELAVGERALTHIRGRFGAHPLYARVDLLPTPDGPVVVELELVEPSLFLTYSSSAASTFAAAIAART